MSETLRKFGTEDPTVNMICQECGKTWGLHSGHYCPNNLPPPEMPRATYTEMTSLKQIKAKLDTLAENDGKLLAALNELSGQIKGLGDGLADEIAGLRKEIQQDWEGYIAKRLAPAKRRSGKGRK